MYTILEHHKGYSILRGHIDHKPRMHLVFTRVETFPANRTGKATGKIPKGMKFKLDKGAGVNTMPLLTYKHINPSEFDKQDKPIECYGQDGTRLKDCNGNPIQLCGTRVIPGKWNCLRLNPCQNTRLLR